MRNSLKLKSIPVDRSLALLAREPSSRMALISPSAMRSANEGTFGRKNGLSSALATARMNSVFVGCSAATTLQAPCIPSSEAA